MPVEQKFITTGEAATVKNGSLPYHKTTFTFEMVAINISYFSFRKSAVWTPHEYLSLLKKNIVLNANASPTSDAWPFGASLLCAGVLVALLWGCHRKTCKLSSFKECLLSKSKHPCHHLLVKLSEISEVPLLVFFSKDTLLSECHLCKLSK